MSIADFPTQIRQNHPDRRSLRLLPRIERLYATKTTVVSFGQTQLRFTQIANPDDVLDDAVEREDKRARSGAVSKRPPNLPYWAELWESSSAVAAHLEESKIISSARVLDLGCGMGLAGLAAAARGASVLFADIETTALLVAQYNALPFGRRVRTRRVDWQTDRLNERFDLILGADILYERAQWEYLEKFWRAHLAPGGRVILGEPGRQTGDSFAPWITPRGWLVEETERAVPTQTRPVRIFELRND